MRNKIDSRLVGLAKEGVRDAFGELILRHGRRCTTLARSILQNAAEADEECQNAYWKAYTHLDQFRGDSEFRTWLLRIIETQCLMLVRRRKHVAFVQLDEVESDTDAVQLQLRSMDPDPEQALRKRQLRSAIRFEIERIPPFLRETLIMRDIQDRPVNDVARQLGISVPAVKSRLNRARAELRVRMQRYQPTAV